MEQAIVVRQRTGWNSAEEALLHEAVDRCRAAGEPLKAAFDEAAAQTGRRPNSVRNHYYSSSKSTGTAPAFLPFSEEESLSLLKTVLQARSAGVEVLDLWNDEEMNQVDKKDYAIYMANGIHPTKAGYREWWTPKFEEKLREIFQKER